MLYIIDTSVVIEKAVTELIEKNQIKGKILIPRAVVAELENQANKGLEIGLLGLEELQNLQKLAKENKIELEFIGTRPSLSQIRYAKIGGEIDALIRELAYHEQAILITADKIQAESAKAFDVKVLFYEVKKPIKKLEIEKYFDKKTMSLHIKEDCTPLVKKGSPIKWKLEKVGKPLSSLKVQTLAKEIVEKTRLDKKSFIEISRRGSTILQYKNFRIVITKPPISDSWTITATRPIKKLNLEDYKLPKELLKRIKLGAKGVIISGITGSGKTTLAQAIAEHHVKHNKIVSTIESPRDLQLPDQVTQYSKNFTTSEEIHDILFLSRPDIIIFDEMRDTPDFKLYTDLRLSGSSVIGVLHSSSPIDTIQRFIGRIETGIIPSILDTILFIEKGTIKKVLTLKMVVKVPTGMTEADLARPIVEVTNFITKKLEFEIYSYGEETVVIPIKKQQTPAKKLASKIIEKEISKYTTKQQVEILTDHKAIVYIPEKDISRVIGKQGKNIERIEKKLGISISLKPLQEQKNKKAPFTITFKPKYIIFHTNKDLANKSVDIYINNIFLFTAIITRNGQIKVHKKSDLGKKLQQAINQNKKIELFIS